jgi:hypothetical protein
LTGCTAGCYNVSIIIVAGIRFCDLLLESQSSLTKTKGKEGRNLFQFHTEEDAMKMRRGTIRTISGQTIRLSYKKPGPKLLPVDLKKRRVNIALAPHWHETGKGIAAGKELSFSAYVEWLIYTDSLCNESVE